MGEAFGVRLSFLALFDGCGCVESKTCAVGCIHDLKRHCIQCLMRVNCREAMTSYRALLGIVFCASATLLRGAESVPLATQANSPPALSVQDASGAITLAARDAITHGTQMHYESAPNKN